MLIILDWGDTVMRVLDYPGPMAQWPEVQAVPGVAQALRALRPDHHLVLATNAADSGAVLVRAALARVGLEDCFDQVLTARELGVRKPDPWFFRAVVQAMDCVPGEAVMVGDDYHADVAGARAAGLRAVWFNPAGRACPAFSPVHDAEIRSMAELPAVLHNMAPGSEKDIR